jgi:hypothetical protein
MGRAPTSPGSLTLDAGPRRVKGGILLGLTLVDHLRLTFGHVIYSHRAHTQLAARCARWNRLLQGVEGLCLLATVVCAVALLATSDRAYAIATAVFAGAAVVALAARVTLDLDAAGNAHRTCGARLWHIREQYRALLADLQDGHLTLDDARDRRDALMVTLHEIYEKAPLADQAAYEAARRAIPIDHEAVLTDDEVDRFLPPALHKGRQPAA